MKLPIVLLTCQLTTAGNHAIVNAYGAISLGSSFTVSAHNSVSSI